MFDCAENAWSEQIRLESLVPSTASDAPGAAADHRVVGTPASALGDDSGCGFALA